MAGAGRAPRRVSTWAHFLHSAQWLLLAPMLMLVWSARGQSGGTTTIKGVEHRPTMIGGTMTTPQQLAITPLYESGPRKESAYFNQSQYVHIGCFTAGMTITADSMPELVYDPYQCVLKCRDRYPDTPTKLIVAAVHNTRCGCARLVGTALRDTFIEAHPDNCTIACPKFFNPFCGGLPNFWGVFKEYDYLSLGANGAIDPWRKIWYTVVVVLEREVTGVLDPDDQLDPERYYLMAVESDSGRAAFQYQLRLPGWVQGIQYDLDSSQIVGLLMSAAVGRKQISASWKYYLFVLTIWTGNASFPQLTYPKEPPEMPLAYTVSAEWTSFTSTSAIISKDKFGVFIFCQMNPKQQLRNSKHHVYLASIPDGNIIGDLALDFTVYQLIANEAFGDVTAAGSRYGEQQYVHIAKVYYDQVEARKRVNWLYDPAFPPYITSQYAMSDVSLHPGLAVSDHLYNKSMLAYRNYSNDWTLTRAPELNAMSIMEVSIRVADQEPIKWCDSERCLGSVDWRIPYVALFNNEPRIPLSLDAPKIISARFTIEAANIKVIFDKNTLKGAIPIDTDGDIIPNLISYTSQQRGNFTCAKVFDSRTMTEVFRNEYVVDCQWNSAAELQINIRRDDFEFDVGNIIVLKPGTIYAEPAGNEYSPASDSGYQLGYPDPLEPPVIRLSPNQKNVRVDECSTLRLDATASYKVGRRSDYNWTLLGYYDLAGRADRIWNTTKLNLLKGILANTSEDNRGLGRGVLIVAADELETATRFDFGLTVTSRWGETANTTIVVEKLDFPAPTVELRSPQDLVVNRTEQVTLLATGIPSNCRNVYRRLEYKWEENTGKFNMQANNIAVTSPTLVIPAFTLDTVQSGGGYNVYNFTISVSLSSDPSKVATAWAVRRVQRSPVAVVLVRAERSHTRSRLLIMDARSSNDLDYPTETGGTFNGIFDYYCITPQRKPCFGDDADGLIPRADRNVFCRTDINTRIQDGGKTYSSPLFNPGENYCTYGRGVLMIRTTNFELGTYNFAVRIESPDGREARRSFNVNMTSIDVPELTLVIVDTKLKFPVTKDVQLRGTLSENTQVDATTTVVYSWKVFEEQQNTNYNAAAARAAALEGRTYDVPEFIFVSRTPGVFDPTNTSQFTASPSSPNLRIKANTLKPSKKYKIELTVTLGSAVSGSASVQLNTAGAPPSGGRVEVDPKNGTMLTLRIISAPDWNTEEPPKEYTFGYIDPRTQSKIPFNTVPLSVQTMTRSQLPPGERSTNWTLIIYVTVASRSGVEASAQTSVQSRPPENKTAVIEAGLSNARTASPEQVTSELETVLAVNDAQPPPPGQAPTQKDKELMGEVLDILTTSTAAAPVTPATATNQAGVILTVVDAGLKDTKSMDALENVVVNAATKGLFNMQNAGLISMCLSAIGSILPDENSLAALSATGASLTMGQRTRSQQFPYQAMDGRQMPFFLDQTPTAQMMSTLHGRQDINHDWPASGTMVIDKCETAYCDIVFLTCMRFEENNVVIAHTCCNSRNPRTFCESPPCWFNGLKCPMTPSEQTLSHKRRLTSAWDDPHEPHELENWTYRFDERLGYSGLMAEKKIPRELQGILRSDSTAYEERLRMLEDLELPELVRIQRAMKEEELYKAEQLKLKAENEVFLNSLPPYEAVQKRREQRQEDEALVQARMERERTVSQIITRSGVLRDTICKQALASGIVPGDDPMRFLTRGFALYFGKTRNMSSVNAALRFPDKYALPPSAPNRMAFSYIFIEYIKNIYGWSSSSPPGNFTNIVTILLMKENTVELEVSNETDPIRVFADMSVFSSGLCMYWDRFAPATAGGAWSTQGLLNDGEGCLTTHLSDIGLFIDGKIPAQIRVANALSYFTSTIDDVGTNGLQMVILFLVLIVGLILALLGCLVDEEKKHGTQGKRPYHLNGDGVSAPKSIDDPIAYKHANKPDVFLIITFINVLFRDHALLGPIFYSGVFDRKQRVLCLGVLVTGIFAVNAAVCGVLPRENLENIGQNFASGVVSGLLVFPLFCAIVFMFVNRPTKSTRGIIKRPTNMETMDALNQKRKEMEHTSGMFPPQGYVKMPPPPGPNNAISVGGNTLLALPPPSLPALPPPKAKGLAFDTTALPSATADLPSMLPVAGMPALPGITKAPSLPPLPPIKATPAGFRSIPPLPKYPVPASRAKTLGVTGMGLATTQGINDALAVGPKTALPPLPSSVGGATSSQGPRAAGNAIQRSTTPNSLAGLAASLDPSPRAPATSSTAPALPSAPELPGTLGDTEGPEHARARELRPDGSHEMAPPLPPLRGAPTLRPQVPRVQVPGRTLDDRGTPRTPPMPAPHGPKGSYVPSTPPGTPPIVMPVLGISRGIVNRGEPPPVPPPFLPPQRTGVGGIGTIPPLPGKAALFTPPVGFPPPPPRPVGYGGGPPPPPPPPPPAPAEDEHTFVRRQRLGHLQSAAREHQKIVLQQQQDTPFDAPDWVFALVLIAPYVAAFVSMACHVVVCLIYSTKFRARAERAWMRASMFGLGLVFFGLEVMRSAVTTIVELRKHEMRRRLAGGDFLQHRITGRAGEAKPEITLKRPPPAKPPLPTNAPPNPGANSGTQTPTKSGPLAHPNSQNVSGSRTPPLMRPASLPPEGQTGVPMLRAGSGHRLPLAASPPAGRVGNMAPMGPMVKTSSPAHSARSGNSQAGMYREPSLMPGKLTPPMASNMGANPPPMPPSFVPPSPSGSAASMRDRLAANRVPGSTPPLPMGGRPQPPPVSPSRPGGRPSLEAVRASKRAQQQA